MAKKNNRKKRRNHPLNANPKRQAHAQLKGYLYQIWHSVDAWLDLADDEVLYLEGAEDFDKVSGDDATVTQVKHTQHKITLKRKQASDAINNFWDIRTNNPDQRVKFCLLTLSKIGVEQGDPFGKGKPGLEVWSRCSSDETSIKKISKFLLSEGKISPDVNEFLKQAELQQIYEQLIKPITWETGSKPISFVERSINDKLILHGNRQPIPVPPSDAKKVVDCLLKETLTVCNTKRKPRTYQSTFP